MYNYSFNLNLQNKRYSGANITNRIGNVNQLDKNIKTVFNKIHVLGGSNIQKIAHIIMSDIAKNLSLEILNKDLKSAINNIEINQDEFNSLTVFIKDKIKLVTNWSYLSGNRMLSGLFFGSDGYNATNDWQGISDNLSKNDKMNIEKFIIAYNHINEANSIKQSTYFNNLTENEPLKQINPMPVRNFIEQGVDLLNNDYNNLGFARPIKVTIVSNNGNTIHFDSNTIELADKVLSGGANDEKNINLATFVQSVEVQSMLQNNPNLTQVDIEHTFKSKILKVNHNGLPTIPENTKIACQIGDTTYTPTQQKLLKELSNMRDKYYKDSQNTCLYDAAFLKHLADGKPSNEFVLSKEDVKNATTQIDNGCLQLALISNNIEADHDGFSSYDANNIQFSYAQQFNSSYNYLNSRKFFALITEKFPNGCIIRTGKVGNNSGHYVFYHPKYGVIGGAKDLNNFIDLNKYYENRYQGDMKIDIACFDVTLDNYNQLKNTYGN